VAPAPPLTGQAADVSRAAKGSAAASVEPGGLVAVAGMTGFGASFPFPVAPVEVG